MTDTHLTQIRFDSFALDPRILAGLADAGFTHCTPIQAETLPIALEGHDVAGQAQTGTGKTAAFLLVLMQRLLSRAPEPPPDGRSRPRALILAPTRELAVQIHKDTLLLARHTGLRSTVVYGGTGYQQQRDDLAAGVDILIGTPGRLIDYYKQRVFDLKGIEVVVLDEADRMFDLGFIKDIRYLFRQMPPIEQRQGLLFSATLSYRVTELAYEHMNHPRLVKIEADQVTAERVRQGCYMASNEEKIPLLIGLIRGWPDGRIIVFVNTKREADRVWGYLQGNGINTAVLSGDVPQKKRLKLLRDFTEGTLPVLVGTDVAARGLHIPDVTHVVNYDLPEDPEDYVHRIGRTARAGAAGDAISFVCETYAFCLPDIESYIGAKVPVLTMDSNLLAEVDPRSRLRPDRADRETRRDGRERGRASERGEKPSGHGRRPRREPDIGRAEERRIDADERARVVEPMAREPLLEEAAPVREARVRSAGAVDSVERGRRAKRERGAKPVEMASALGARDAEPVEPSDELADESGYVPRLQRLERLEDDLPERLEPEIEIPDMPIVRRVSRRSRHQVEPAALTSPPLRPIEPVVELADTPAPAAAVEPAATGSEAKSKRRRRRRKPASGAGSEQVSTVTERAPEVVE